MRFFDVGGANTVEQAARIFYARLSGGERHWWGHRAAFEYDLETALARVRQPILVLNPSDDLIEQTRRATTLLRNGGVQEMPRWTHGFMDNDAEGAADVIKRFLDEGVRA